MKKLFLFLVGLASMVAVCAQDEEIMSQKQLQEKITSVIADKRAVVGISVLDSSGNKVVNVNDSILFPLLSVFKFPCALAVLDKIHRENISLDSCLYVSKEQLPSDTYSPLRERYPEGGIYLSLSQLLTYSLSLSDNNACDILISWMDGIEQVQNYVRDSGFSHTYICANEAVMHVERDLQRLNKATPHDVAMMFYRCFATDWLPVMQRYFLEQVLFQTVTGKEKLLAGVPKGIAMGHKTGSSDRAPDGKKIADNDAGFVVLPDGKCYYIAVFVCDSYESDAVNASIIATVSSLVYKYMSNIYTR